MDTLSESCKYCDAKTRLVRGMCNRHYQRWKVYGDALHPYREKKVTQACKYCDRDATTKGMCPSHWMRYWRFSDPLHPVRERRDHKRPSKKELARLYWGETELSCEQIAPLYGVNYTTIHKWLKHYEIPRRSCISGKRARKVPEDRALLVRMYQSGMTLKKIAAKFKCQWEGVRRELHRAGIKLRPKRSISAKWCRVCGKPVVKQLHPSGRLYGTRCQYHQRLYEAKLNRDETRKRNKIPPERWKYEHEIPESYKKTRAYQRHKEKQCQKQAKNLLAEARSFLKQPGVLKSQNEASQPDKTS